LAGIGAKHAVLRGFCNHEVPEVASEVFGMRLSR
jgi:hypothetical protein